MKALSQIKSRLLTGLAMFMISIISILFSQTIVAEDEEDKMISKSALLFVTQKENVLEKQIGKYLNTVHDISGTYKFFGKNQDNLQVRYTLGGSKIPRMVVYVDINERSRRKKDNKIIAQIITINGFYVIPKNLKTSSNEIKILKLINKEMSIRFFPDRIYLDGDMDLRFESTILIPAEKVPVHAETVHRTLLGMMSAWEHFYPQLAKSINLPKYKKKK